MTEAENEIKILKLLKSDDWEKSVKLIKKNPEKFEQLLILLKDADPVVKEALKKFKEKDNQDLKTVKDVLKDIEEKCLEEIIHELSKRFKFLHSLGGHGTIINIFKPKGRFAEPVNDLIQGDIVIILQKYASRPEYQSLLLELGERVLKVKLDPSYINHNPNHETVNDCMINNDHKEV